VRVAAVGDLGILADGFGGEIERFPGGIDAPQAPADLRFSRHAGPDGGEVLEAAGATADLDLDEIALGVVGPPREEGSPGDPSATCGNVILLRPTPISTTSPPTSAGTASCPKTFRYSWASISRAARASTTAKELSG